MKIRFCSFLTIALFLLPALQGTERDSLSLLRTIAEYEALPAKWIETVYTNPATRYYQHCTSLTRISLNGVYGKEDEAALLQAGDGYLKGAADVSSWIKLSDRTRLWGNARYTTGKETGVVWNETADFELLYPYVMGRFHRGRPFPARICLHGRIFGSSRKIHMGYRRELPCRTGIS